MAILELAEELGPQAAYSPAMMRPFVGVGFLSVLALFAACDDGSAHEDETASVEQETNSGQKAKLQLKNGSSTLAQTSARPWSLTKTGTVDTTASTVTWTINATQGATGARRLVVTGRVNARNNGQVGAPIGNVVVTLQSKSGNTWITRSSDVANATQGDAATSAKILDGSVKTITENSASGSLALVNANNNATISLPANVVLPAGASVDVKFTASFNNDVLNLPTGTKVRAEVFVSFGNAGPGNTASNVDINGNGGIDSYEARVDTASTDLGDKTVPAAALTTTPVSLTDTSGDITTTGTVTFSNAVFNLGATMGTVTVSYDGGDAGGTINNCAHLTGTGLDLVACKALPIAAEPFEWATGDVVTLRQVDYDVSPLLTNAQPFATAFPQGLLVGTFGQPNRFFLLLTNGPAVQGYLATGGTNTALTANHIDPTVAYGGQVGGELVAVTLNIGFSAGDQLGGLYDVGELYLCGLASPSVVNDTTVASFLAAGNTLLGGGAVAGLTLDDANTVAAEINAAFLGGVPSTWANTHLSPTPCP
jgi:hypothetical protein